MAIVLVAVFLLTQVSCGGGGSSGGSGGGNNTSYTVTASAGAGGSFSPASATVNSGATVKFVVTPDSSKRIDTVTGCGGTLVGNTYTTGAVTTDCTITASFISNVLSIISIGDASITEGNSGTTNLIFTVTLSALANGNVNVDYATSNGSAKAGSDYTASNGTLTIPAANTSATISIGILGDINVESNETLTLTLSNPSGNATLGTATATGTILNDDIITHALNDTGITTCADNSNNGLTCPQATYPGQDAEYGRDATANVDNDGHAGFSFTKLDANGNPLSSTATGWDCVQDNVTDLIWEVKTTDSGLRHNTYTYTWYNSTGVNDGNGSGTKNGGACVDSSNCDTEKYVIAVNVVGLCGKNDWHLPTVDELISLVDSSFTSTTDSAYFPNTAAQATCYWSSSPYAYIPGNAWCVGYDNGYVGDQLKSFTGRVRLVRGGQ